jgi:hypothetical protein
MGRAGVIATEIAVCGVLFRRGKDMIRHVGNLTFGLRGQVLTALRIVRNYLGPVLCRSPLHSSLSKAKHGIVERARDTIRSRPLLLPLLPRQSTGTLTSSGHDEASKRCRGARPQ